MSKSLSFISFIVLLKIIKNLYPEILWFRSMGVENIWWFELKSAWMVFLGGFLVGFRGARPQI